VRFEFPHLVIRISSFVISLTQLFPVCHGMRPVEAHTGMTEMLRRIVEELCERPDLGADELSRILYPGNPAMVTKVRKAMVELETLGFIDGEGKLTMKGAQSRGSGVR
jgi:hypothetical protein